VQTNIVPDAGYRGDYLFANNVMAKKNSLASIMSLLLGITVAIYGLALLIDRSFPKWLGYFAIVGGIPTAIAGLIIAYTGFSGLAMAINMPSSSLLLVWMIAMGVYVWRKPALS
jgi:Domain of unknown function (DUF4386)